MKDGVDFEETPKLDATQKRNFAFRLNIFFFCTFALFSILIFRLAYLQFVEGASLSEARMQITNPTIPIPPIRGTIYDYKGYPIAYSVPMQSVYYRLEADHPVEELVRDAKRLSQVFQNLGDQETALTPEEVIKLMDAGYDINGGTVRILNYSYEPRRIKADLNQAELAYLMEHRDEFKGIEIVEESVRMYDDNTIATQLVGYVRLFGRAVENAEGSYLNYYLNPEFEDYYLQSEMVGYDGIEFMYQEQLRGINGSKSYPVNRSGRIVGDVTLEMPKKGNNLYLTLDKDVQLKAEQAILDHLDFLKSAEARRLRTPAKGANATTGYAVAIEVDTGKVVAMASMPDYSANIWNGGRALYTEDYNKYRFFFGNGTIRETYPNYEDDEERKKHPTSLVFSGSVIKPLSVLVGLQEGLFTVNQRYMDTATYRFGKDGRVNNAPGVGGGSRNAQEAIRVSSNTFMAALIGNELFMREFNKGDAQEAVRIWDEYMTKFGLGVRTGSGLPGEIAGTRDYLDTQQMGSAQASMVFASFGQAGKYTALQLAQYTATLASRGKRMKPQFVDKITDSEGNTIQEFQAEILNEVEMNDEYWDVVHRGMVQVSQQGFDDFPYTLASKTGTSEQSVAGKIVENATFIAYAPAENPKLAVAVIVPEGGYGAWGAAPIARAIFDAYDEHFGLTGTPREQAEP